MPELNPQQQAAIRHRGTSVVLAAGAGCGKTTVLTERYLSHLRDDGAAVSEAVAITFTERAAREMRGRIRKAVEAELKAAPGSVWERHRRDLDAAPIDTIHGYCGRLLRRFPAGGLPGGFRVFDDPQAASVRAEAVRAELHRLLTDAGPVGDDLRELAVLFGWATTVEAVEGLLDSPDRDCWLTWSATDPDWHTHHTALLPQWVEYLSAAGGKLAIALRTLERLPVPEPGAARVKAVLDAFASPAPATLAGLSEQAKVLGLKKGWADPDTHEAVKDAFTAVREGLKELDSFFTDDTDWSKAADVGRRFLRVAAAADDAYRVAKRRAGGADFHDLLVRARDLLRDDTAARAAVQAETRFLLVDEFQDTDPVQLELVRLAVGDGYRAGRLFAVGDRKQSIYRFRGADVGLFESLERDLDCLPLTKNYRSQPGVIGFVNALFRRRLPGYEPLAAYRPQMATDANVEFLWAVPHEPTKGESAEAVRAREADAVARRIAALVADGVKPGDVTVLFRAMSHVAVYETALRRHGLDYYVVGGRAFFARQEVFDLANMLTAVENPHDAPALAGALRSPAGGLPDDALHLLAGHSDGLWAGLHDDTRLSLLGADRSAAERCRDRFDRWRTLKDRVPIAELVEAVFADSGFDAASQFEPLGGRKLANLWKLLDLARGFDRDGLGLAAFAARLSESVAGQPREEEAATVPEQADDVVRLMSIHKAKGLEFPVVVVPDLGAAGSGDRHPVARWQRTLGCLVRSPSDLDEDDEPPFPDGPHRLGRAVDEIADWQESLRVLYVAATRARDLLILSSGLTDLPASPAPGVLPVPSAKAVSGWLLALSERYDLLTGGCVDADGPRAAVRVVRPGGAEWAGKQRPAAPPPGPLAVADVPFVLPPVVSLAALQAFQAGDEVRALAVDPSPTSTERLVRVVMARWDFADRDGWQPLLAEASGDEPTAERDEVRGLFERFAGGPRQKLAGMGVVRRGAELLFEPAAVAGDALLSLPPGPTPALSARIDLITKDAAGRHLWLVHVTERPGRNPWADAKPWLGLVAAAGKLALGEPVRSVGLLDFVAGEVHTADARRLSPAAGLAAVGTQLKSWIASR